MRVAARLLVMSLVAVTVSACAPERSAAVLDAPAAPSCERSIVLRTNFAFNSYRLSGAGQVEVAQLASAMLASPLNTAHSFDVNGHTDVVGRLGYNMGLSMLRAGAVVDALVARGVPIERLRAQGFGPLQLLDQPNPRSGINRRVEIVVNYC